MKKLIGILLSAMLLTVFGLAQASDVATQVEVRQPYVRSVPPGQPHSAAFMQLYNADSRDHILVAAESPVAEAVELHAHRLLDGMMQMRPVEKVDLPAGATVRLEPGGLHVMLIGLQRKLLPGETVSLRLVFEDGSGLTLSVPVREGRIHRDRGPHGEHADPGKRQHQHEDH